jgi:hypothetical protein
MQSIGSSQTYSSSQTNLSQTQQKVSFFEKEGFVARLLGAKLLVELLYVMQ